MTHSMSVMISVDSNISLISYSISRIFSAGVLILEVVLIFFKLCAFLMSKKILRNLKIHLITELIVLNYLFKFTDKSTITSTIEAIMTIASKSSHVSLKYFPKP